MVTSSFDQQFHNSRQVVILSIESMEQIQYPFYMVIIGSTFSSDEIEDIQDAAVVTGVEASVNWDKSRVIVSAFPNQNVDYQLKKVGESYVMVAADGREIGSVDHIADIIPLLEAILKNRRNSSE